MKNVSVKRRWTDFAVNPGAKRHTAYVSINAKGFITLNREAWAMIGNARWVSLLYDRYSRAIGVQSVSHLMPNSFPVTGDNRGRIFIRGKQFIHAARIDISYCIRFLDPHLEGDTLILDLNHTTRVLGFRDRSN